MRWRQVTARSAGAMVLAAALALPVGASEPIPGRPLPDEGTSQLLGEEVTATLPFDLDGDGTREMVVVSRADAQPGSAAIEAWWVGEDGSAERSNQVILRRTDLEGAMIAVRIGEQARLFTAIRDGREVLLVAGNGGGAGPQAQCCVTIWEVRAAGGTEVSLDLMATTGAHGAQLVAADLDADGTDEVVMTEIPDGPSGSLVVGVLGWDGNGYPRTRTELPVPLTCCFRIQDAGETDGVAGDDVLLLGAEDDGTPALIRLTMRGGVLVAETAQPDFVRLARVLSLSTGPALLTGTEFQQTEQWTWPRDQPIGNGVSRAVFGWPLAVLGSGVETRIVAGAWPDPSSVTVMTESPDAEQATFAVDIRAQVFQSLVSQVAPEGIDSGAFTGEVPGGLPGIEDVYVLGGTLIRPTAGLVGVAEAEPIATLLGRDLAGAVGRGGGYMAVLTGPHSVGDQGFGAPVSPRVTDLLSDPAPRSLHLVETASVLEPETDGGALAPAFLGAAPDPDRALNLRVASEAMSAEITGPPGTRIWWSNEGEQEETVIGADGVARLPLVDAPAPDVPDGQIDRVSIWLLTPAGHAYRGTWLVSAHRQPPDLVIDDAVPFFDVAPVVSGRTVPGSTVTVSGRPVELGSDGSFSVRVDVGVVPTEVRVVVTDQLGNRAERVVTRVWPLDYRQLPWIPITVALTVAAGVVLFLRTPGTGRGGSRTPDEDSIFEEIGG